MIGVFFLHNTSSNASNDAYDDFEESDGSFDTDGPESTWNETAYESCDGDVCLLPVSGTYAPGSTVEKGTKMHTPWNITVSSTSNISQICGAVEINSCRHTYFKNQGRDDTDCQGAS